MKTMMIKILLNTFFLKVGQYPSIADLHISKVKNHDKVLYRENSGNDKGNRTSS
jgi:hypothetical protein